MRIFLPLCALALCGSAAGAVTINFDDQPGGSIAGNLVYSEATFSPGGGGTLFIGGPDKRLCTLNVGCVGQIFVDFLGDPSYAANLTFVTFGENIAGDVGDVVIFGEAGVSLGTADVLADGDAANGDLQDFSGYGLISRIEITWQDVSGLSVDDFNFDILVIDRVPAPAGLALLALGMTGLAGRRFRPAR